MSQEQAILDIAKALDNIHQVLIHLTNAIQAGAPVTSSSLDADPLPGVTRAQAHAAFNPAPDPAPDPDPPVSNNAAPDPQPSANGNGDLDYQDFAIDSITFGVDDNGNDIYKGRGHPFIKFGVRIWPEVFKRLGVSTEDLVKGENSISPIHVRAVLNEYGNPRKIVGLAPGDPPAQDNPTPIGAPGNEDLPQMPAPENDAPPFPEPYPQRKIRGTNYNDDEIPF